MFEREEYDCLYGKISLNDILTRIIDTKEFQRLRRIKQLGGVDYVYKDATHTRYEHSIGTAYLAGLAVDAIRKGVSCNPIDEHDKICVQIAALCHDLGHGPFSYVFQDKVLPQLGIDGARQKQLAYKIFRKIWKDIVEREKSGHNASGTRPYKLTELDMLFIKELIIGTPKSRDPPKFHGREDSKRMLYRVFSNENVSWDMCKLDYLRRDCLNLGCLEDEVGKQNFYIMLEGENLVPSGLPNFPQNLILLNNLRMKAYQNPKVNAVEHMISDAIVWGDEHFKISTMFSKLDNFCNLDDTILGAIRLLDSDDANIIRAKEVLKRIDEGKHYELAAELELPAWWDPDDITEIMIKRGIDTKTLRMSQLREYTMGDLEISGPDPHGVIDPSLYPSQEIPAVPKQKIQIFCVNQYGIFSRKQQLESEAYAGAPWTVL